MNSTKKPSGPKGFPQPENRQAAHTPQFTPVVAQFKRTPAVAPPVYRPQPVPRVLQTKTLHHQQTNTGPQRKQPAAPPTFRPLPVPKVLQAKMDHQRDSVTHVKPEFKPFLRGRAAVVQAARHPRAAKAAAIAKMEDDNDDKEMAEVVAIAAKKNKWIGDFIKAGKKGDCGATIYYSTGDGDDEYDTYEGAYSASTGVHGEMDALEDFLNDGRDISTITYIAITSPPCKVCNAVLNLLGLNSLVGVPMGKESKTGHKSAFKVPDIVLNAVCVRRGIPKAVLEKHLYDI